MNDFTYCHDCKAVCNKEHLNNGIFIKIPESYPDNLNISEEDKINGLRFCSYMCAMNFLEECQRETFKLNIKNAIYRN